MKFQRFTDTCVRYRRSGLIAALATVTLGSFVLAQEESFPARVQGYVQPRLSVPAQSGPAVWGVESRNPAVGRYAELRGESGEMSKALEVLRNEDATRSDRDEARDKIAGILDKQFESDLENREKQIGELEKQIDQLRAQIKKRRAKKGELIELRVQLMVNEAEGLGFPNAWNNRFNRFPGSSFFYHPATPVAPAAPAELPGLTTRPRVGTATVTGRRYEEAADPAEVDEGQSRRRRQ